MRISSPSDSYMLVLYLLCQDLCVEVPAVVDKGLKHKLDKPSLPSASFCSDTNAELRACAHKIFCFFRSHCRHCIAISVCAQSC